MIMSTPMSRPNHPWHVFEQCVMLADKDVMRAALVMMAAYLFAAGAAGSPFVSFGKGVSLSA